MLLKIASVDVVVVSLSCDWADYTQSNVARLCQSKRVVFCRDMDVSYDVPLRCSPHL